MHPLIVNLILVQLSLTTAVFVYAALRVVEYLNWKRKWREENR